MHPLYREVGFEIPVEDKGRLVFDQARLGGAVGEDVQHQGGIEPGFSAEDDTFIKGLEYVGQDQVLRQFGVEPHARSAAEVDLLSHRLQPWQNAIKNPALATSHEGQSAVDRSGRGTGAWGAEEVDTGRGQGGVDSAAG